jgi:hypothetical protein
MTKITEAMPKQMPLVRKLFLEYAATLDFDLSFQGFEQEISQLPGDYAAPRGCLLLALDGSEPIGCVALRPLESNICEMKRDVPSMLVAQALYRSLGFHTIDSYRENPVPDTSYFEKDL